MTEVSRTVLFGKLNSTLLSSLESATSFCKLRGNPYVELVHWLHQLMQKQNDDLLKILAHYNVNKDAVAQELVAALDRLPRGASSVQDLSEHIDSAVERAWVYTSLTYGAPKIRGGHLLLGMLNTVNLRNQLNAISPLFIKINAEDLQANFDKILAGSIEDAIAAGPGEVADDQVAGGDQSMLSRYGTDLTEKARKGELDPIAGRDEEIRQIIDILMRRRQNNPLLTGEAGVGKTAVIEGLAMRIAKGDVPKSLKDVRLYLIDISMLQAGAGMKGEFESRLQALIKEVQSSPVPIILFIDEIHTLIGAGGAAGTGDAANLLKPALARGQLRTLGATTWSEYKKYIEKDPALTRRFQVVQIHEPGEDKALMMLRLIVSPLEKHHNVLILDEAVSSAVSLSHRYIPARQLPDKAVSLLDTACARVAVSQYAEPSQVENCKHRISNLEIELEIAQREREIGIGEPDRVEKLEKELEECNAELVVLDERWQKELDLCTRIIDLRAELQHPPVEEENPEQAGEAASDAVKTESLVEAAPEEAPAKKTKAKKTKGKAKKEPTKLDELNELQLQLTELQGESPLIFPSVDANTVASVVADWTGIPLGRMMKDEVQAVLQLTDTMEQRVIGQRHGLEAIARRIRTSRARLDDPNKPVGVFLLTGPSGVGKTETALALSEILYGGEQNAIILNMSEFQEAHTVSTLKGAPPGYVGYGEGGVLTEAVRRRPYSVVLLDEIEKAHQDVHEIFFQVFDKGWMEDGEGRHIDFRNTIIILTSNVGTDLTMRLCSNPEKLPSPETLADALRDPLLDVFPAALLGRLLVVPYYPLSDKVLGDIVRLQLSRVTKRLVENHNIECTFDDALIESIVNRCTAVESGGRMVDAVLTNSLLPQISHTLLTAGTQGTLYRKLHIGIDENGFVCNFKK